MRSNFLCLWLHFYFGCYLKLISLQVNPSSVPTPAKQPKCDCTSNWRAAMVSSGSANRQQRLPKPGLRLWGWGQDLILVQFNMMQVLAAELVSSWMCKANPAIYNLINPRLAQVTEYDYAHSPKFSIFLLENSPQSTSSGQRSCSNYTLGEKHVINCAWMNTDFWSQDATSSLACKSIAVRPRGAQPAAPHPDLFNTATLDCYSSRQQSS